MNLWSTSKRSGEQALTAVNADRGKSGVQMVPQRRENTMPREKCITGTVEDGAIGMASRSCSSESKKAKP